METDKRLRSSVMCKGEENTVWDVYVNCFVELQVFVFCMVVVCEEEEICATCTWRREFIFFHEI